MHHNSTQEYQPYKRPLAGSRELLLQQDMYEHQSYPNQQARNPPMQGILVVFVISFSYFYVNGLCLLEALQKLVNSVYQIFYCIQVRV